MARRPISSSGMCFEPGLRIDGKIIKEENLFTIVNIENVGNVKVIIDNDVFYIKTPFINHNIATKQLSYNSNLYTHKFPCFIEPGGHQVFIARHDDKNVPFCRSPFYRFLLRIFSTKLLRWTRILQIKAYTYSSNGKILRLRISEYQNKKLLDSLL